MKELLVKSQSALWGIAVYGLVLLLLSCNQSKRNSVQSVPMQDDSVPKVEYQSTDGLNNDTTKNNGNMMTAILMERPCQGKTDWQEDLGCRSAWTIMRRITKVDLMTGMKRNDLSIEH